MIAHCTIGCSPLLTKHCNLFLQLPPLFAKLLEDIDEFGFSESCINVFSQNFICPFCVGDPPMCPDRCTELVFGCISPVNQPIAQLDTSLRFVQCKT